MGLEEQPTDLEERLQRMAADYEGWLDRQPLSANTKRSYRTRVRGFLQYLAATPAEYGDPFSDDAHRSRNGSPGGGDCSAAARGRTGALSKGGASGVASIVGLAPRDALYARPRGRLGLEPPSILLA